MQTPLSEEEKHRLTLEGLADIDAGRLIDHDAVVAWAESLSTDASLKPPRAKKCVDGRVKPGHDAER